MDELRDALENAVFRTKGHWYRKEEVDDFLRGLTVGLEKEQEDSREKEERIKRLEERAAQLEKKLEAQAVRGSRIYEDLREEREELIEQIRLLYRLREEFRRRVQKDAQTLLQEVGGLPSDELL